MHPSIFREYDIRGLAGSELSIEFAECLGLAYANFIQGRKPVAGRKSLTVSVGRDCRLSSDGYAEALVKGMIQGGLDVIRIGVCPTPLTYFSVFHLDLDGAIMVTGSHNPKEYNGFKICVGRDTIHGHQIQELRVLMEEVVAGKTESAAHKGAVSDYEIIAPYQDYLVKNARRMTRKKIVLDAGNGTASTVAPELFRRLGADVVPLYCELDGRFPNHHPDPTVPSNLKDLIAAIKREKADFGIAFDGDADRIGLVDETGRIIYGDELMVLFARDILLEKKGATIISEVKSSHRLYADIAAKGGKPIMWKTGHSLIKSKMKETGAALAGEMSGHIFFADRYFGFDDAVYAALRVYEIASKATGPISSLLADLPKSVSTPEIRVDCQESLKFKLVEETKRRLSASGGKINDIDGVRIDFGDGWGLVRASNTQPALVLRFEASTEPLMNKVRDTVVNALEEAAIAIGHPGIDASGGAH
ncbi:MAG: phosphomannomutase/phosphoglucomutase [Oligoflexia bacterium]|nr:phosphomannomutase/phosphoglucomutase [Oligoflexia bacterium]